MSWPWEENNHGNLDWVPPVSHAFTWTFAHTCSAKCPYCFAEDGYRQLVEAGHRWWTDDQAVEAWANVADRYGQCSILFSGLEPGEQLELVSRVLHHHYGGLQTNLTFDLDEFQWLMRPDRIYLHPTFHPHLWGFEPEPFIKRVTTLQAGGYKVPLIAVVGYPPYLPRLDEYVEAIREVGAFPNVAPMRLVPYKGKMYPDAYTEAELEILRRHIPGMYTPQGTFPPLEIARCACGHAAACVVLNGDVWRCGQLRGMGGSQNLIRDGNIEFDAEPQPCHEETCECGQFSVYWLKE